jgi:hypothetical protein
MKNAAISVLILCGIYRILMGKWPDPNNADFINAIDKIIGEDK